MSKGTQYKTGNNFQLRTEVLISLSTAVSQDIDPRSSFVIITDSIAKVHGFLWRR